VYGWFKNVNFLQSSRHVGLLSLKCHLYNQTFPADIMDGVIAVECRIKRIQPRVSAPDIPTITTVTVSKKNGSNKGTIDVVWKVSNTCLNIT